MTYQPFSAMTPTQSNTHFPRTTRPLSTPRIKSKLSTLSYDSSDMETSRCPSPCTSCQSSPDEIDSSVKDSLPRKPTISRLSFPFVKSAKSPPSNKAVKMGSPPLPIPPCPTSRPASSSTSPSKQGAGSPSASSSLAIDPHPFSPNLHPNTQRQTRHHRGYSRHALAHIKWFWAMREEDWETKTGRPIRLNKPHLDESFLETALDDPLASIPDTSLHQRKTPLHPVHQPQLKLPPMTIHPRRGDLASLRDPYCIGVDRSFAVLPTWTIGKTLWMYDIHLAFQDRACSGGDSVDMADPYDDTESESESVIDASASSVGYSDDSDMTLVDSETESELPPGRSSSSGDIRDQLFDEKRFITYHDPNFSVSSASNRVPLRSLSETEFVLPPPFQSSWPRSAYSEPSPLMEASSSRKPLLRPSAWAIDWYRRWAYVIEVSHRGQSLDGQSQSMFFIGQEVGD